MGMTWLIRPRAEANRLANTLGFVAGTQERVIARQREAIDRLIDENRKLREVNAQLRDAEAGYEVANVGMFNAKVRAERERDGLRVEINELHNEIERLKGGV